MKKHGWLSLIGPVLVGAVVGTAIGLVPTLDRFLAFVLLFVLAVGVLVGLGWWAKATASEWWALHDPNPVAPALKPRYWPGSKADLEQKAAEEKARLAEDPA